MGKSLGNAIVSDKQGQLDNEGGAAADFGFEFDTAVMTLGDDGSGNGRRHGWSSSQTSGPIGHFCEIGNKRYLCLTIVRNNKILYRGYALFVTAHIFSF